MTSQCNSVYITPRFKNVLRQELSCSSTLSYGTWSRWWYSKKFVSQNISFPINKWNWAFSINIIANWAFSINFPMKGVYSQQSSHSKKRITQTAQCKNRLRVVLYAFSCERTCSVRSLTQPFLRCPLRLILAWPFPVEKSVLKILKKERPLVSRATSSRNLKRCFNGAELNGLL